MVWKWLRLRRICPLGVGAALLLGAGMGRADDKDAELRALIEQQNKQIQELKKRLDAVAGPSGGAPTGDASGVLNKDDVQKIVGEYLKENPAAAKESSSSWGYDTSKGVYWSYRPDTPCGDWQTDSKVPFELRFRGRIQLDYYNYKVTDGINHVFNTSTTQDKNTNQQANFSQLEIKRLRLIWEGFAFTPDLRYKFELDAGTRGLAAQQNNKVIATSPTGGTVPNTQPVSPIGGASTGDDAVRLFSAWVAYDFHGPSREYCIGDCDAKYAPTYTIIAGKLKPFFSFEEYMGSGNEQMVEYGMSEWFFDADDDNLLIGAGFQVKAMEDRFYMQGLITNGSESQFPNNQMDNYPGFNLGFWYDFGGTWNSQQGKWDLYGDTLSDIDDSPNPVVRVGGATNIVPLGRRSIYGDAEQSRFYTVPGAPQGGTRLINLLNGDSSLPAGAHAVDQFDAYSYEAFISAKYHGFSITNDWFFRNLNNFRSSVPGMGDITYTDAAGKTYLFPANHGLFDYGTMLQAGYFIVPHRLEIAARWSWIKGNSGDPLGNFAAPTKVASSAGTVLAAPMAFRENNEVDEFGIGINYYFKRELLKWQTDFSWYVGGNPAGGGANAAGFIAGSDGWLLRTQIQLGF